MGMGWESHPSSFTNGTSSSETGVRETRGATQNSGHIENSVSPSKRNITMGAAKSDPSTWLSSVAEEPKGLAGNEFTLQAGTSRPQPLHLPPKRETNRNSLTLQFGLDFLKTLLQQKGTKKRMWLHRTPFPSLPPNSESRPPITSGAGCPSGRGPGVLPGNGGAAGAQPEGEWSRWAA